MKGRPNIRRFAGRIGLQRLIVKADDQKSAVPVAQRKYGFDDLGDPWRLRRIEPSLDLNVESLAGAGQRAPEFDLGLESYVERPQ